MLFNTRPISRLAATSGAAFARAMRLCAAFAFGAALSLPASGQSDLTLPPFTAMVSVSPVVAGPGTARTITVSGLWPNSCAPGQAILGSDESGGNTVVVRLTTVTLPQPCLAVITPYSRQVNITPSQAGVQRVLAFTTEGSLLGQGTLVTQGAQTARSLTDLTGVWYDNATNGSGLTLLHSFAGSDILVGGWFVFDQQGRPSWYAIQHGGWQTPTVFWGQLLAYEAAPGGCNAGQNACPKPATSHRMIATVRIEVLTADQLLVEAHGPVPAIYPPPPPNILFRSVVTRLQY